MNERTLPQAAPPASTGTQAATPEQLKRSAELSANASGDSAPRTLSERYELRELLAKGGMGSVHAAWDRTFDRAVAVKLIHDHLVDEHAIKRFRHEARIAGQLQHPNIPPVYDLGLFEGGKPYLAMKLVKGRTLDDHIKHPGGDTPNLVAVFEAIAQAIGYAHSRGVIHRDLKPQNVMVGAFGEVQVMDWGLAKVMSEDHPEPSAGREPAELSEQTADPEATTGYGTRAGLHGDANDTRTTAGSVLGTPAHMPPEQARGEVDRITERSDVFGLGAILLKILTGHSVFGGSSAEQARRKAATGDVADAFARLDGCAAEPELIALAKRCLAPDPASRYANGTEVANATARIRAEADDRARTAELDRTKAEAEVRAQRKRRQVLTWSAAVVMLVLTAGIVGTALGLREAKTQEENAKNEAIAKGAALEAEKVAKNKAETNLGFAKKGNEILGSVFAALDPKKNYTTVGELSEALTTNLGNAVKALDGSSIGDPLDVAKMQNILGLSLLGLGEPKQAIVLFERSMAIRNANLDPYDPDAIESIGNLAVGYDVAGRPKEALPYYAEAEKRMKICRGPLHRDTLQAMNNLAVGLEASERLDESLPLHEQTLKLRKSTLGVDDKDTLESMNNLALAYYYAGRSDDCIPLLNDAVERMKRILGPDNPTTLTSTSNLAVVLQASGRLEDAILKFEESWKKSKAKLGPDHLDTIRVAGNLATAYEAAGRQPEALTIYAETLKLKQLKLGPDHPEALIIQHNLATAYQSAGKLAEALPLFEENLRLREAKLGADHPKTLESMNSLAKYYHFNGRLPDAIPLYEQAYRASRNNAGLGNSFTLTYLKNLATALQDIGRIHDGLRIYEEVLSSQVRQFGLNHPNTLLSMANLTVGYYAAERIDDAREMGEQSLGLHKSQFGIKHPDTIACMKNLADVYRSKENHDKAIQLLEEALKLAKANLSPENELTIKVMERLAYTYLVAGRSSESHGIYTEYIAMQRKVLSANQVEFARQLIEVSLELQPVGEYHKTEIWLRECLAIREKQQPNVWVTYNTQSMLGESLLGQKKFAESEPYLVKGYEGLIAREKSIPPIGQPRLPEALDRLIWLYTATNRLEEAKKYRDLRSKYPKEQAPKPRPPRPAILAK